MIVITGAAGFIGSYLISHFNANGIDNILAVDKLGKKEKWKNLLNKKFVDFVDREAFLFNLENYDNIEAIIHLGACSDTAEFDLDYLMEINFEYSKFMFNYAVTREIPFIYASSAATYGAGEHGYTDDESKIYDLSPLNPYGFSKQLFDQWVLNQTEKPPFWTGLKFFNVYGPNEYHKGRMASVVYHSFNQLKETGKIKLFKSHKEGYADGEQLRDFVYVKDVAKVISFLLDKKTKSGIYNLGAGKARPFKALAQAVIDTYKPGIKIEYFDMPEDIRDRYQYFTEADMNKLKAIGYSDSFYSLEDGVEEYVREFLIGDYRVF